MKKKLPLSIFEIVAYSILALLALWGLVYIALGFSCDFISVKSDLYKANANLGTLGFLYQGLIILAVSAVVAVVVLLIHAKTSDREYEKNQRRAARLAKETPNVVDVEATSTESAE